MIVTIEIPKYSHYKYEFKNGFPNDYLCVDRVLNQAVPQNYGFFPATLCGDGDPLDVFVISNEPIQPGANVKIELVGGFECIDGDQSDDKLIGILEGENIVFKQSYISEIYFYLTSYKEGFRVIKEYTLEEAFQSLTKAEEEYAGYKY